MYKTRKQNRVDIISYVRVCERKNNNSIGFVKDLNNAGIRLKSLRYFNPQSNCHLAIALPYPTKYDNSVAIDAKVIWCTQSDLNGYFDTGIELHDVKPHELDAIEKFIEYVADTNQFFSLHETEKIL